MSEQTTDVSDQKHSEQSYSRMSAGVTTYGGEKGRDGIRTAQHWQLHVNGHFIADTSDSTCADLFRQIADRCSS